MRRTKWKEGGGEGRAVLMATSIWYAVLQLWLDMLAFVFPHLGRPLCRRGGFNVWRLKGGRDMAITGVPAV